MNAEQVPESAVLAVLEEMGWPDDREKSDVDILFIRYWDIATDVVRAALNADRDETTADVEATFEAGKKGVTASPLPADVEIWERDPDDWVWRHTTCNQQAGGYETQDVALLAHQKHSLYRECLPAPVTFAARTPLSEEEYQAWTTALAECRGGSTVVLPSESAEELRAEGRIQAARRLGILKGSAVWRLMTEDQSSLDLPTDGEHIYRSTACLHGVHSYCQGLEGQCGEKIPGVCKFCRAGCICVCHTAEQLV